jgi:hypothetical protein
MKHRSGIAAVAGAALILSGCFGSDNSDPTPPTVAPAEVTQSGTNLTWAAVAGAQSYVVYANCSDVCTATDQIAITTEPKYTLTEAASSWRVVACTDNAGKVCGPLSASATSVPIPSLAMSAVAASEVTEGQTVSLLGRASPKKGKTVASWQWSQFGNDGDPNLGHTPITITNADKQNASFVAPTVTQPTRYAFMLLATDSTGAAGSEIVVTTVKPADAPIVALPNGKKHATAGSTVTLNAIGSAEGGTYSWQQVNPDPLKATVPANLEVVIQGANTPNPSFIVPQVPSGTGTLAFEVTHTAPNGKKTKAVATVTTTQPPAQTVIQAAQAGTLNQPLTIMPDSGKKSVPPQTAITLYGNPDATVIAGAATQVSINASGGNGALSYSWRQIGGTSATLSNDKGAVLGVTAAKVTTAETLSFELTVTDSVGKTATGISLVNVHPQANSNPPTQSQTSSSVTLPISYMIAGQTIPLQGFPSEVASVTVIQRGGRPGTLTKTSDKVWSFTAPAAAAAQSEPLGLAITMNYTNGSSKILRLPIQLLSPTGVTTVPPNAGWVVPPALEALALQVGSPRVDEGTKNASISANASGGTLNYTYSWTYVPDAGSPHTAASLNLRPNGNHLVFDAPVLTKGGINLNFLVKVDDGKSFTSKTMMVNINDLGDVVASNGNDLRVPSGQKASLSFPAPTGGVPPYSYAVTQLSGTTVALTGANTLSPSFTAPTLAQGAASSQLWFEMTVTDAVGNTVKAREYVAVEAPVRFKVTLDAVNGPVTPGTAFNLHASAGGTSVAPITYKWAFLDGRTDVTSQLTLTGATTDNPSVTIPAALAGKTLRVGVQATDSTTPTAQTGVASPAIILQVGAAPAVALPPLTLSFIAPTGPVPTDVPFDITYAVTQADPSVQIIEDCSASANGVPASVGFAPPTMTIPAKYAGQTVDVYCQIQDENGAMVDGSISVTVEAGAAVAQGPDVDQTVGQAISCQVCEGKLCLIAESTEPVGSGPGICMTTIIDDTNFGRTIRKYVAPSTAVAVSLWWDQTSDNTDGCMTIFNEQLPPNGQSATCHYACVTTGCNSDIWPAVKTLYIPPGGINSGLTP